jgi:hypothetical protein
MGSPHRLIRDAIGKGKTLPHPPYWAQFEREMAESRAEYDRRIAKTETIAAKTNKAMNGHINSMAQWQRSRLMGMWITTQKIRAYLLLNNLEIAFISAPRALSPPAPGKESPVDG